MINFYVQDSFLKELVSTMHERIDLLFNEIDDEAEKQHPTERRPFTEDRYYLIKESLLETVAALKESDTETYIDCLKDCFLVLGYATSMRRTLELMNLDSEKEETK